jgi:hypothetical protein
MSQETRRSAITATRSGQAYRISLALPPSYNEMRARYPVLYLLDPNGYLNGWVAVDSGEGSVVRWERRRGILHCKDGVIGRPTLIVDGDTLIRDGEYLV